MTASAQHADALALLDALIPVVKERGEPVRGYENAGKLIDRSGTETRHMGQVASRLDLAAFYAGLPMLAMHWVRKPSGEVNPASFSGALWGKYYQEMMDAAETHPWTDTELALLRKSLISLPEAAAVRQWKEVEDREFAKPGYISYNLHRRLRDRSGS